MSCRVTSALLLQLSKHLQGEPPGVYMSPVACMGLSLPTTFATYPGLGICVYKPNHIAGLMPLQARLQSRLCNTSANKPLFTPRLTLTKTHNLPPTPTPSCSPFLQGPR